MSYQEPINHEDACRPYLPGCSPLNLSSRGRRTREYLDTHKNVEKRRRDRINNCLETIRQCVPACRQIPMARRLEKGEILDMTISYLQLVNHFLAGIGIQDVYSASKQQVQLYMGVDNWIREHHSDYDSVSEFAKDVRNLLQNEIDILSTQVTIEHSWSSRKTAALGEIDDHLDNKRGHSSCSANQSHFDNGKPTVPCAKTDTLPTDPVTIKQECEEESPESCVKRLKFSQLVDGVVDGVMKDEENGLVFDGDDVKDEEKSSEDTRMEMSSSSSSISPCSKSCNAAREAGPSSATPSQSSETPKSCQCPADKCKKQTTNNIPVSHMLSDTSIGDIKVNTPTGSVTIPIRLGSIQIEAPKEMLLPLQQACIQPIVFNAQIQSSALPGGQVADKCSCKTQQVQPLTVQITEARPSDCVSQIVHEDASSSLEVGSNKDDKTYPP